MVKGIFSRAAVVSLLAACLLSWSSYATAVVPAKAVSDDPIGWLTPEVSDRAESDMQIRRLKNLLVSQNIDFDGAFKKLERLQKKLRGNR